MSYIHKDKDKPKEEKTRGKKSKELCDRILSSIIEECLSLRKACERENVSHGTFLSWCNEDKELADQYARARELRTDIMAEEILEISDSTSEDDIFTENGNRVANSEWIARSRLRVDARKWLMAKMQPKKYGDKIEVDNKGEMALNVIVKSYKDEDWEKDEN